MNLNVRSRIPLLFKIQHTFNLHFQNYEPYRFSVGNRFYPQRLRQDRTYLPILRSLFQPMPHEIFSLSVWDKIKLFEKPISTDAAPWDISPEFETRSNFLRSLFQSMPHPEFSLCETKSNFLRSLFQPIPHPGIFWVLRRLLRFQPYIRESYMGEF